MKNIIWIAEVFDKGSHQTATVDARGNYSFKTCERYSFTTEAEAQAALAAADDFAKENGSVESYEVDAQ